MTSADGCDFLDRKQHACFVIRPHDGHDGGVLPDGGLQVAEVDRSVEVDRQVGHLVASFFELPAKLDVGRVLHGGCNDMPLGRIGEGRSLQCGVIAFRAATGEYDVVRVGPNQPGHAFAGLLDQPCRLCGERIGAGWVAPVLGETGQHCLDDLGGNPRRGVVIQINQSLFAHRLAKRLACYTLNLNSITSPSCTTYSLPSIRYKPRSRAAAIEPHSIKSV